MKSLPTKISKTPKPVRLPNWPFPSKLPDNVPVPHWHEKVPAKPINEYPEGNF